MKIQEIYKGSKNLHERDWDQRNTQKKKRGDPQSTQERQEIYNIHERLWKRKARAFKRAFKSIQREGFFKPIFQPWSRVLSKPSRSLQSSSSSLSKRSFKAFINLEEIQKGDSSFE